MASRCRLRSLDAAGADRPCPIAPIRRCGRRGCSVRSGSCARFRPDDSARGVMANSRHIRSLTTWEEFAGSLDDAIFDCNAAAGKAVWELALLGSDHLRVRSSSDAKLMLEVEFFP